MPGASAEEGETMTHGPGYFGFESIILAALTVLVLTTLGVIAHAVTNVTALA